MIWEKICVDMGFHYAINYARYHVNLHLRILIVPRVAKETRPGVIYNAFGTSGYYYYLFVVDEVECGGASLSLFTSRIVFWNITGSSVRVTLESPRVKKSVAIIATSYE